MGREGETCVGVLRPGDEYSEVPQGEGPQSKAVSRKEGTEGEGTPEEEQQPY